MAADANTQIPVLVDAVGSEESEPGQDDAPPDLKNLGQPGPEDREILIAELQTQIAANTFELTDEIMRTAFAEMEASVFEQISGRLRRELPEMIDALLRERFGEETDY